MVAVSAAVPVGSLVADLSAESVGALEGFLSRELVVSFELVVSGALAAVVAVPVVELLASAVLAGILLFCVVSVDVVWADRTGERARLAEAMPAIKRAWALKEVFICVLWGWGFWDRQSTGPRPVLTIV